MWPRHACAALLVLAGAAAAQAPAGERPVPRESESNAVTGIVPERYIGDAALSPPKIAGNAMLTRAILSKGDPAQVGWPGALLAAKDEVVAASLQPGEATSMMRRAEQLVGYVKAGTGRLDDGQTGWDLKPGYAFLIPADMGHRISATGDAALEMTIMAGPRNESGSRTILVRDSAKLLYVEQGAHWVNLSKAPFRDVGERFLLVYMAPMTIAGAHAHPQGWEEVWVKLSEGTTLLQVGSEIRPWRKDQGFVVPPNGRTIHAAINNTNQRQLWFYFASSPRPPATTPPRPQPAPDPAFAEAIVQANIAGAPLAPGRGGRR